MGEITLNREQSEQVLANPDSEPGSRIIAAFAIAFFEACDSAEDADRQSIFIAQKLLFMAQKELYEAGETFQEVTDGT